MANQLAWLQAKKEGYCFDCKEPIAVGDAIGLHKYAKGKRYCFDCAKKIDVGSEKKTTTTQNPIPVEAMDELNSKLDLIMKHLNQLELTVRDLSHEVAVHHYKLKLNLEAGNETLGNETRNNRKVPAASGVTVVALASEQARKERDEAVEKARERLRSFSDGSEGTPT